MTTFIELHALRSFPPSNLNRDDLGTPKTAVFGGASRLRISKPMPEAPWRMSEHFRGEFVEDQLGTRTDRLPDEVLREVGELLDDASRAGLLKLLESIGRKKTKEKASEGDGEDEEDDASDSDATAAFGEASDPAAGVRTAHLLFLTRQEVEAVADFAKAKKDQLAAIWKTPKDGDPRGRASRSSTPRRSRRRARSSRRTLRSTRRRTRSTFGLFGRFVTSDELDTVDGALQVAHGLGTQKVEVGVRLASPRSTTSARRRARATSARASSRAPCSISTRAATSRSSSRTWGARTAKGRTSDDEAKALARKSLPALVRAMAEATPKGKKTGTAPHTPAEYVEVVVRRGAPLSFANAFLKPVDGPKEGGDVMAASITRLSKHRDRVEHAYGRDADAVARFVLCLSDVEGVVPARAQAVDTVMDLAKRLATALAKLPVESTQ